jgi:transposase InsO family protein
MSEHARRVERVFEKLRAAGLSLKLGKCHFALPQVNYLGHVISAEGVRPDPEKVSAVQNFPTPKTVKETQSFLGLTNYYRRFVENYATIARPLTRLLRKGAAFVWTPECDDAVDELKKNLISSPVLVYPDFSEPFVISTDASNYAVGAVLSQVVNGEEHPVAYASRQLKSPEIAYTTTEKELLAVVWSISHFRCYVYGRKFTIVTDHAALKWLFGLKDPSSRLLRWELKLGEYDYEVTHKPGKKHLNADALSRKIRKVIATNDVDFGAEQAKDDECSRWKDRAEFVTEAGVLYRKTGAGNRIVVPMQCRAEIMRQAHEHILSGHGGVRATTARIERKFWWPHLKKDVKYHVLSCIPCNQRSPYGKGRAPLQALPSPRKPFEFVALDVVGPLPKTVRENRYILTMIDHFSRYLVMVPMQDQTAETVASVLVKHWILKFGVPAVILSDQGSNFMSELFRGVCNLLQIRQLRTSPGHPEGNGRCERVHRSVAQILSHYVNVKNNDWDEWLDYAVAAYNSNFHSSIGFSPHEIVFGEPPVAPFTCVESVNEEVEHHSVAGLRERLEFMWRKCFRNDRRAQKKQREETKTKGKLWSYRAGDYVYLSDPCLKVGQVKKFHKPWKGPYQIMKVLSKCNLLLELPFRNLVVHRNRVKPYRGPLPPPRMISGERRRGRPKRKGISDARVDESAGPSPLEWEDEWVQSRGTESPRATHEAEGEAAREDAGEGEAPLSPHSPLTLPKPAEPQQEEFVPATQEEDTAPYFPPRPQRSPYLLRSRQRVVSSPPYVVPPPAPSQPYYLRPRQALTRWESPEEEGEKSRNADMG